MLSFINCLYANYNCLDTIKSKRFEIPDYKCKDMNQRVFFHVSENIPDLIDKFNRLRDAINTTD